MTETRKVTGNIFGPNENLPTPTCQEESNEKSQFEVLIDSAVNSTLYLYHTSPQIVLLSGFTTYMGPASINLSLQSNPTGDVKNAK